MRKVFKIVAIMSGIALAALVGVVYCISTKVEDGLVSPVLIPFVLVQLVLIMILIAALFILCLPPKKQ